MAHAEHILSSLHPSTLANRDKFMVKKMESQRCNGTQVSSRWNPTKEQISILENLYEQGIRTPSADQIQDITATLSAYSHIEGKNVFYWFQNHKARQRQKQKQESLAYFNRFLYSSHPIFSPPLCPSGWLNNIHLCN